MVAPEVAEGGHQGGRRGGLGLGVFGLVAAGVAGGSHGEGRGRWQDTKEVSKKDEYLNREMPNASENLNLRQSKRKVGRAHPKREYIQDVSQQTGLPKALHLFGSVQLVMKHAVLYNL